MRWEWNYPGFGELLCGPEMVALMRRKAEACLAAAEAIAPDDYSDPIHYKDSFTSESGVTETLSGRRAYGRVTNTAPYAAAVEWGNSHAPAQHVLGKAVDAMRD